MSYWQRWALTVIKIEDPEHDHPTAGKVKLIGYPVHFSATPTEVKAVAPEHGQHTEEVLLDQLGFDWDEIAKLRDEGII